MIHMSRYSLISFSSLVFISLLSIHRSQCFIIQHTSNNNFHRNTSSHLSTSILLSSKRSSGPITEITPRVIAANVLIEKRSNPSKPNINNNNPVTKLETNHHFNSLPSQRDKSFTRNLVSTTTRRKGQIDVVLSSVCDKYPPKCGKYTGIVISCMRMGAAQVLFMDVKNFAAVMETVNVLKHEQFQTP